MVLYWWSYRDFEHTSESTILIVNLRKHLYTSDVNGLNPNNICINAKNDLALIFARDLFQKHSNSDSNAADFIIFSSSSVQHLTV